MSGNGQTTSLLAAAGAAALLAGCAGKPAPAPAAAPQAMARPTPPQAPASPPPRPSSLSLQDSPDPPLSPGDWTYAAASGGSVASFGPAGVERFSLRCDAERRRIVLAREGSTTALRLSTTYGRRALPPAAELPAEDPLLDEMAFSRGRFTIEAEGHPALILPAWPEPARVIEDCRG